MDKSTLHYICVVAFLVLFVLVELLFPVTLLVPLVLAVRLVVINGDIHELKFPPELMKHFGSIQALVIFAFMSTQTTIGLMLQV